MPKNIQPRMWWNWADPSPSEAMSAVTALIIAFRAMVIPAFAHELDRLHSIPSLVWVALLISYSLPACIAWAENNRKLRSATNLYGTFVWASFASYFGFALGPQSLFYAMMVLFCAWAFWVRRGDR